MPTHVSIILDERVFDKLSPSDKEVVLTHIQAAGEKIQNQNLTDNEEALQAMHTQGVKIVKPTKEERESWQAIEDKARKQAFDTSRIQSSLLEKLQQYAEAYEKKKPENK